jgi:uncharacterized protein
VVDQQEAEGHAVRAGYLYAAIADVAALTGDQAFIDAIDRIWENTVSKKLYVQGGIGAIPSGERFGANYELPNATAYNETCAAIANIFWNYRMFLLHGDSKYMDVLEKTLYNGMLSGVGMDGKSFFYTNAMQVKQSFTHSSLEPERSGWFDCSCCPTNVVRLIPSIPGYVYATKGDQLYINLFMSSRTSLNVEGRAISVVQQNNYPWNGTLSFTVSPLQTQAFAVLIRIPGWAGNEAIPSDLYHFSEAEARKPVIKINGTVAAYTLDKGYAVLRRTWKRNDQITVELPMDIRQVEANKNVADDIGKAALQRGPIMFCAEWPDNGGKTSSILLPRGLQLQATYDSSLLHGVVVLSGVTPVINIANNGEEVKTVQKPFKAIPYYAWAHRGKGEMTIWFPRRVADIDIISHEQP